MMRTNKKLKIGIACLPCWEGYTDLKQKLPRKKKKQLKKVVQYMPSFHSFVPLCRCNQISYWKEAKKWIPHYNFLEKHKITIKKFYEAMEDRGEECSIGIYYDKLELFWHWEDDNGLWVTDGKMPAIWEESKKDKTWSFDETMDVLKFYQFEKENIKSFKQLIERLHKC